MSERSDKERHAIRILGFRLLSTSLHNRCPSLPLLSPFASRVAAAGMLIRRENHEHLLVIFIFIEFFTEELNDNENPPFVSIVFYILEVVDP